VNRLAIAVPPRERAEGKIDVTQYPGTTPDQPAQQFAKYNIRAGPAPLAKRFAIEPASFVKPFDVPCE
jgi:hypothetical protein